jgi:regulatory protein YycI of two-component signal transduction system YycFG
MRIIFLLIEIWFVYIFYSKKSSRSSSHHQSHPEEEQVNIIEPSDPITPMNIGNFAPGTDSMDSDAEIENHERQLEQTKILNRRNFF